MIGATVIILFLLVKTLHDTCTLIEDDIVMNLQSQKVMMVCLTVPAGLIGLFFNILTS